MNIIGIDPGPLSSGVVCFDGSRVLWAAEMPNDEVCKGSVFDNAIVCIESIQCYGLPVGRETFDTCYQIGRFIERCELRGAPYYLYPRPTVKAAITGLARAKDKDISQALAIRFGGYRKGEPLALIKGSHLKSALALAVYHSELPKS